jgi:hypothetical protein
MLKIKCNKQFLTRVNWKVQGFLNAPFKVYNPIPQSSVGYIKDFRPFNHAFSLIVICQTMITSSIPALLCLVRPLTILRGITFVAVNPFKSKTIFPRWKHVISKVFKGVPSLTDFYSPSPVKSVAISIGITATLVHIRPFTVNNMFPLAHSMSGTTEVQTTPASFSVAINKVVPLYHFGIATITQTLPEVLITSALIIKARHNQFTKSLSSQIFSKTHKTKNGVRSSIHRFLLPARTSNNLYYSMV